MTTSILQLTNQIKQKSRSIVRCCKEFDTYLEELETDRRKLAELTAKGETTTQAENVVKETEAMIPIVRKNAIKMTDSFLDFWESSCDALNAAIASTSPDRAKLVSECGQTARLLKKITEKQGAAEGALDAAVLAMMRAVQADLELLSTEKPIPTRLEPSAAP